jgi:hypothetical protein
MLKNSGKSLIAVTVGVDLLNFDEISSYKSFAAFNGFILTIFIKIRHLFLQ